MGMGATFLCYATDLNWPNLYDHNYERHVSKSVFQAFGVLVFVAWTQKMVWCQYYGEPIGGGGSGLGDGGGGGHHSEEHLQKQPYVSIPNVYFFNSTSSSSCAHDRYWSFHTSKLDS